MQYIYIHIYMQVVEDHYESGAMQQLQHQVLRLLALLVRKYNCYTHTQPTQSAYPNTLRCNSSCNTNRYRVYFLYWYQSTNTDESVTAATATTPAATAARCRASARRIPHARHACLQSRCASICTVVLLSKCVSVCTFALVSK